jgi:hypothetical protein
MLRLSEREYDLNIKHNSNKVTNIINLGSNRKSSIENRKSNAGVV